MSMGARMRVMVMSTPGRELVTARMLADWHRQNPTSPPVWVHSSTVKPGIVAFYEMLEASDGDDVLFLEDDIVTARNFVEYARQWDAGWVTSFFHVGRLVLNTPVSATGFSLSQAVKLPAGVIARMLSRRRRAHHYTHRGGQDDEIGAALSALGELVVYHRSLVQHVGAESVCWGPERTLEHR